MVPHLLQNQFQAACSPSRGKGPTPQEWALAKPPQGSGGVPAVPNTHCPLEAHWDSLILSTDLPALLATQPEPLSLLAPSGGHPQKTKAPLSAPWAWSLRCLSTHGCAQSKQPPVLWQEVKNIPSLPQRGSAELRRIVVPWPSSYPLEPG